jgi:hypothetical protein
MERAERAFRNREYQDTIDALTDLARWRASGGFWPDDLDARFSCIFDAVMSDEVFDTWGSTRLSADEEG